MPPSPINVIIVDDHRLLREGLKSLLRESGAIEVIGEAADGEQAIKIIPDSSVDVVLMDISLPGIFGYDVVREIKKIIPAIRFLMITNYDNDMYFFKCIKAGASGLIHKDPTAKELEDAILQVYEGKGLYYKNKGPEEIKQIIQRYEQAAPLDLQVENVQLTPREKEILKKVLTGKSYKEIAEELFISTKTVENHRRTLLVKFNVKSSYELLALFSSNEKLRRLLFN